MTDPITCPECEGRRGEQIGDLFLACQFCGGHGWVGGDNEPAARARRQDAVPTPAWEHRVWSDPWIAAAIDCRICLGARRVTHVDGESRTLISVPCACVDDHSPE